jgi:TP901-1 family phage major tail protein
MATNAFRGRDLLLEVASSTSPTTWTAIAGLRTTALSINNNPVDVTNKGSSGYRELLADGGVQSFAMSGDGVYLEQSADNTLFLAALNRTTLNARISSGAGDKFIGTFVVTSYQRTGNFDGAEMFSVSLESTGTMIYQA